MGLLCCIHKKETLISQWLSSPRSINQVQYCWIFGATSIYAWQGGGGLALPLNPIKGWGSRNISDLLSNYTPEMFYLKTINLNLIEMYSANFFSPCLMWFHPQSLRKQRRIWLPWKSKLLDWHGNTTGCWRSTLKHRWVAREGFVIWRLLLKRFLSGGLPSPSPQMSLESSTTLGPYSWILTNVDFENASGPMNFIENNFSQLQLGNLGVKFVTSYMVFYPCWPY